MPTVSSLIAQNPHLQNRDHKFDHLSQYIKKKVQLGQLRLVSSINNSVHFHLITLCYIIKILTKLGEHQQVYNFYPRFIKL